MLQPKNIKKNKISLTKNFYLSDLLVLFFIVFFSILVGWFIIPDHYSNKKLISILVIFSIFILNLPLLIFIPSQNSRIWLILFRFLKFNSENKEYKYNSKTKNTKNLLLYDSIDKNGIIKNKPNFYNKEQYIKIFKFKGKNVWIQSLNDRKNFLKQVLNFFNLLDIKISFVKKVEKIDFKNKIEDHKEIMDTFLNKNEKELSIEEKNKYKYFYYSKNEFEILNQTNYKDVYYVVIYGNNHEEIYNGANFLKTQFTNLELELKELSSIETINFLQTYFNPFVENENNFDSFKENESSISLENFIKINNIKFKNDHIKINDYFAKINTISEYALDLNFGWADTFFNSDSDLIVWHLDPINYNDYEKMLDKADNKIKTSLAFNKRSIYRNKKDLKYIEAIDEVMHLVNVENQKLFNSSMFFINFDKKLQNLRKRINNNLIKNIKLEKSKINKLFFRQNEAFSALNFGSSNTFNESIEMVSRNIAYSWPFTFEDTNDNFSFYLGNSNKRNIVLDIWKRSLLHTNSNCVFFGLSGKGKTTAIKKLILDSYFKREASIIIIDPQREYQDFKNIIDVNWLDLGTGQTIINPLEIQNGLENSLSYDPNLIISNHINKVLEWLEIINPNFNNEQKIILILGLKNLYKKWNFFNRDKKIHSLKHSDFPIMNDLICEIENINWTKTEREIYFFEAIKLINFLKIQFQDFGPYAKNYNGHTNLEFKNNFTIIDIKTLSDNSNIEQVNAAIFLILFFIQNKINDNFYFKNKKTLLVIDEVHKFIDENNLKTLNFIFQTTKTIRKFNGSIILSTQNASDFALSKKIINKTHGILKNIQYKFFFNLPGEDIENINNIFDSKKTENQESQVINKIDEEYLTKALRGQILLLTSKNNKIHLNIHYNEYEKELFFKERQDEIIN